MRMVGHQERHRGFRTYLCVLLLAISGGFRTARGFSSCPLPMHIRFGGTVSEKKARDSALAAARGRPNTKLYGVLSRATILKHSSSNGKSSNGNGNGNSNSNSNNGRGKNQTTSGTRRGSASSPHRIRTQTITKTFLLDALDEATHRQTTALECLEAERSKLIEKIAATESKEDELTTRVNLGVDDNDHSDNGDGGGAADGTDDTQKKKEKNPETALDRVDARRMELGGKMRKLEELRRDVLQLRSSHHRNSKSNDADNLGPSHSFLLASAESRFRSITTGPGGKSCPILDRPKDTWKMHAAQNKKDNLEFGRPAGFTGLVFYSPLGVPILVGRPRAEGDGVLRRAAQGSDLWFQVEDYDGSRVLLRSSLVRGTKDSKKCAQMAADLAARYSAWGSLGSVPVMYTDSKHVAKRGTRAGRMRKKKSLGRLMGRPCDVEDITRGLEPS